MNPTGQPFGAPFEQAPPPGNARQDLNVPSILLIVVGAIGVLNGLVSLATSGSNAAQVDQLVQMYPQAEDQIRQYMGMFMGGVGAAINVLSMLVSGAIIYGAIQMRSLKMYPLAITAAVLAMIPCWGCCCIGLPVGIWALTILLRADVKTQFV